MPEPKKLTFTFLIILSFSDFLIFSLFNNDNFDYNRFMHKLEIQPGVLHDCASRAQYKLLIEDIYNYKSREKVNLRY